MYHGGEEMKENIFLVGAGLCLLPFVLTALAGLTVIGLCGIGMGLVFIIAGQLAGWIKV